MKIDSTQVATLLITELEALDPVSVFIQDYGSGRGSITITCYGKAWTTYWGGMGDRTTSEFFCSCDEHYIAKNLSDIDSQIFDIDAIREDAEKKGVECYRDDPWNDYEFLTAMYGNDMTDWHDKLPKTINNEYEYLCRIIKTVQSGLKLHPANTAPLERGFPVLGYAKYDGCPKYVKRSALDDKWAIHVHSQTLDKLESRGGLCPIEIVFNVNKLEWATKVCPKFAVELVKKIAFND